MRGGERGKALLRRWHLSTRVEVREGAARNRAPAGRAGGMARARALGRARTCASRNEKEAGMVRRMELA